MADKIDNINGYDIDLPPDATPSIAALTVKGGSGTNVGTCSITVDTSGVDASASISFANLGIVGYTSLDSTGITLSDPLTGTYKLNYPTLTANSIIATQSWVEGKGYTTNQGTVTSVGAGTGLSISGTASVNPTVGIASGYKLPTTTEWSNKSNLVYRHSVIFRDDDGNPYKFVFYSTSNTAVTTATSGPVAEMMQYCIVGSATSPGLYMHLGAITGVGKGRTIPFVAMYQGTSSVVYYAGALSFGVGTLTIIGDSFEAI